MLQKLLNAPASWLDVLVLAVLVLSLILATATLFLKPSRLRGALKFGAGALLGMAPILAALDQVWTRHIAARHSMTGTVTYYHRIGRKTSKVCFGLSKTYGHDIPLCAASDTGSFQGGETMYAEWMTFDHTVLRYTVLDGPHQGDHFRDVVPWTAIVWPLFGLAFIGLTFLVWRGNPTGDPNQS